MCVGGMLVLEVCDGVLVMWFSCFLLKDMLVICIFKKMGWIDEDWYWFGSVVVGDEKI